ncbi:MAG: hypothetical protein ACOH2V_00895 [Candidatus Saccharimonadaceae bacterium]
MDFSFSATAGASQSTAKPRLAGNNIYNVKFDGCEIQDITGVKDPTAVYKVLKLKFSNDDGSFEHTVFEPRAEDFQRKENEFKNKEGKTEKIPQPSGVESMMLLFKHAIDSIVPGVGKKLDDKEINLGAPNWEALRTLIVSILDKGKGSTVGIKLMKNTKTGEATFPGFFTGLTKEGQPYIKNNFIGAKLAFSTYELQRISNATTAKPTQPEAFTDFPVANVPAGKVGLDMDFNV